MKDTVSGDPGENLLVIVLEHPVHAWELVLAKHILESKVQVQLKTLLSSGGEGSLLSSSIVGELDGLVDRWEVDQGVEEPNPV